MRNLAAGGVLVGLFASSLAFGGVSDAAKDDCTQSHSFAYCAMDLIGRSAGIIDLPTESIPAEPLLTEAPQSNVDPIEAGIGVSAMLGGTTVGYILGGALLIDAIPTPAKLSDSINIFVVMPSRLAEGKDPQEVAFNEYAGAIKRLIGASIVENLGDGYLKFVGGDTCQEKGCVIRSTLFNKSEEIRKIATKNIKSPPKWFGLEESVFVWIDAAPVFSQINDKRFKKTRISPASAASLSKELPDWFYTYIPSHDKKKPSVLMNGGNIRFTVFDK